MSSISGPVGDFQIDRLIRNGDLRVLNNCDNIKLSFDAPWKFYVELIIPVYILIDSEYLGLFHSFSLDSTHGVHYGI